MKKILFLIFVLTLLFSNKITAEYLIVDTQSGKETYELKSDITIPVPEPQPEEVPAVRVITQDITIQYEKTILANAINGNIRIKLKQSSLLFSGQEYLIKKIDSSTNTVTIVPFEGETIDGQSNLTLSSQNEGVKIVTDNLNWYVIGRF